MLTSIAILLLILVIWTIWGNMTVGMTHYTVQSDKIPAAFHHYKIVVVSDLHNAEFGKDNRHIVELIGKEQPDMIAITGDLVDLRRTNLEIAENLVRNLVKIAPCYYVTGNHEAWIGEKYPKLEEALVDQGVIVLRNRKVTLTKENKSIYIAGLDDPDFTDSDPSAQKGILQTNLRKVNPEKTYGILLSHRPEAFEVYVAENIDLVLAGHAHGGQFRLPFIGGLFSPNQGLFPKYDGGKYIKNRTTMIVSRGIGNSVIPIRFNNRPELVVIELLSYR